MSLSAPPSQGGDGVNCDVDGFIRDTGRDVDGLRASLQAAEQRRAFLDALASGGIDYAKARDVLLLKCARATGEGASQLDAAASAEAHGLDEEEVESWRVLMSELTSGRFEGSQGDGFAARSGLAEAIGDRMGLVERSRLSSLCALSSPRASVGSALKALSFVELGV